MQRARAKVTALLIVLTQILAATPTPVWAADKASKDEKKDEGKKEESKKTIPDETTLSYPELEVTPRASERLEMEAKNELRTRWLTHLPIQFSALTTIYAATQATYVNGISDSAQANYELTKKLAVGVGAGWLALTIGFSAFYRPYFNGYKDVARMPATNKREELTRERIAEEALYAPDSIAVKMKWFSVGTNLLVNLALFNNNSGQSDMPITIGVLGSFAPLLFESRWSTIAERHREYKKKIYGPVASTTLLPTGGTDRQPSYQPGLGLLWVF
jgi:hypothetical protein